MASGIGKLGRCGLIAASLSTWAFVAGSLGALAWVVGTKWASPAGTTTIFAAHVGELELNAWGLTYIGMAGVVLAVFQALLVIVCASFTLIPQRDVVGMGARRVGHVVLIGWAMLWLTNLAALATMDRQGPWLWMTAAMAAITIGVVARSWQACRATPDEEDEDAALIREFELLAPPVQPSEPEYARLHTDVIGPMRRRDVLRPHDVIGSGKVKELGLWERVGG